MQTHRRFYFLPLAAVLVASATVTAQETANFQMPIPRLEKLIASDSFGVANVRGSRGQGDRTQRVTITFDDSSTAIVVKFGSAPPGGHAFNNSPRYEVAAYEFQKLFLESDEYVVPPTVLRVFDVEWFRQIKGNVTPTFDKTTSVLAVLQYWMMNVSQDSVWDSKRFDRDTLYARRFGNLNILTYLIRHNDANAGNILISTYAADPRLFSVDNGLAFGYAESDKGTEWRLLRVNRLPRQTVERMRKITRADLDRALEVIAEYEIRDGVLVPVEKTANLDRGKGVRQKSGRIQFGLTKTEIDGVENRLRNLLKRVDGGGVKVF